MNQWRKGVAHWTCGDTLYLSVPFTWLLGEAEHAAKAHKGRIVAGGPAVKLCGASWAETPESVPFDVLAMHNPCATFTTRGCPNRCTFCAVPKIEGDFIELDHWKPAPMVCDNNLLASSRKHFARVVDSLRSFPANDFNQGLDARRFTSWHAEQLAELRCVHVRFAFDHVNDESAVADAIALVRLTGLPKPSIYVLMGFRDTPDDARYRLEKVVEWGATPCPMRYQPLDATEKNAYVAPGWTDYELRKMGRYYWKHRFFSATPYEDFVAGEFPLLAGKESP